jgi:hypothetical protein
MGRRLRIFIGSTMRDLANERAEVIARLETFNFEPVNAESWRPNGQRAWERIQQEIESCDVFILLLGERYGWLPDRGPKADEGKAVTHLEYLEARRIGLPILSFFKELPYDADRTSDDARRRDDFRQEVADWQGGQVVGSFALARQLGSAVARAVVDLLSEDFQAPLRRRAIAADAAVLRLSEGPVPEPELPSALVDAVRRRDAVLFAGAGISLEAGYPAAAAWCEFLMQRIRKRIPDYDLPATADNVRRIAGDLEFVAGRAELHAAVRQLMTPPQTVQATAAHRAAVRYFRWIVTSNYDDLFERASREEGRPHRVVHSELSAPSLTPDVIVNLYGSFTSPDTMVLTEDQANVIADKRNNLWQALCRLFETHPLVVVGTSLRGPSTTALFCGAVPALSGYYVDPVLAPSVALNARRWTLHPIRATAAGFCRALEHALGSQGPPAEHQ